MRHVDPTTLSLVAVGESAATPRERHHIDICPSCTEHVRERHRVVGRARAAAGAGALFAPRAEVWLAIRAELGLTPGLLPGDVHTVAEQPRSAAPVNSAINRQRQVRVIAVALVLAVVLGAVVVGMLVWPAVTASRVRVLASATLDAFPLWPDASGTAVAQERSDGSRELLVRLRAPANRDSLREVWLVTGDTTQLVSLGELDGHTGLFAIPDGLDLGEWGVVDISEEPPDGDPGHSGDSIVRGPLI